MTAEELADEEWGPVKEKGGKKKKGKKGKGKVADDDEEDGAPIEASATPVEDVESKKPVEMTAEELADEEWGSAKSKGKKGKKGKQDAVGE